MERGMGIAPVISVDSCMSKYHTEMDRVLV